ncbi:Uncharacterised protein [uncultured archaeon]|nr:Uncharacterised protein [uncultured archaeon]
MNKEKMFEIEMAKEFGQEFVDKIKALPDETHVITQGRLTDRKRTVYIQFYVAWG